MLERFRLFKVYLVAILAVGVATILTQVLEPILAPTLLPLFFAAVAFSSWYGGLKPGIASAVLSTLVIHYLYFSPPSTLIAIRGDVFLRLGIFFVVAVIISVLNANLQIAKRKLEQLSDRRVQASEEQLRLAMQAARMGMWNWNLVTGEIHWSAEHEQLLGLAPGTFDGRYETFDFHLHPDDRAGLNQAVQTAIQEHSNYKHEYRTIWADGSIHWLEGRGKVFYDETGQPVRMTGTIMNIDDRKQAEAELQKYKDIFQFAEHGLAISKGSQLEIVNPAFAHLHGYSVEEMANKCILDLFPPEYQAEAIALLQQLDNLGHLTYESTHLRKDGTVIPIFLDITVVNDQQGNPPYRIVTTLDISERKQVEAEVKQLNAELEQRVAERTAELQRTNDLFNSFFNAAASAAIGLCIHDRALRFVQVNEALAAINGHSIEAHLGKTPTELLPELAPTINPLLQQVIATGQPILNQEIAAEAPSQAGLTRYWLVSYFPVLGTDNSPQVVGVGVIIIEISDRKQAEAILLESDRRWRSLLNNVQLLVVGLNHNGAIEYVNPFFLQLMGYTSEEVLGKNWFEHFLPSSQKSPAQSSWRASLEKNFRPHCQNSIVTRLGEERMVAWSNTLLQNAEGQSIGTISIGEDITERYNLERMKAEFISIVSHELRTPLTSISGALELLSTGLIQPESERGRETIEIAATEADRLTRLVNDILDLERLESGKIRLERQSCDLAELMRRAADFMQLAADQATITLSVEPLPILLEIDGDRILQVLTNLLSNAIKFSPNNSTIWLTAKLLSSPDPLISAPHILITVRDQGRGIPVNKLEQVFERFQQVDASDSRKKGGTGLGLAICRSIVQQHGGNIWVESVVEQGSSFHFTLPLTSSN